MRFNIGDWLNLILQKIHKHDYQVVMWRLVHYPDYEPASIVQRLKCEACGKERNYFPEIIRDEEWENTNSNLRGYWEENKREVCEQNEI